jgi:hypothetical protein
MKQDPKKRYATSNAPANRNGNYSVVLDFNSARPTVEFKQQPERKTFTEKQKGRNFKK